MLVFRFLVNLKFFCLVVSENFSKYECLKILYCGVDFMRACQYVSFYFYTLILMSIFCVQIKKYYNKNALTLNKIPLPGYHKNLNIFIT